MGHLDSFVDNVPIIVLFHVPLFTSIVKAKQKDGFLSNLQNNRASKRLSF